MAHRLHRLRSISRVLLFHRSPPGWILKREKFSASSLRPWARAGNTNSQATANFIRRFSVASCTQHDLYSPVENLTDIKSIVDEVGGSMNCWLNNENGCKRSLNMEGVFFIFLYEAAESSMLLGTREWSVILNKIKLLQQRCPDVNYFLLQCGTSENSIANHTRIIRAMVEEFITCPIIVTEKIFPKVNCKANDGGCFLVFEGSTNHALHFNLAVDSEIMTKAIKGFQLPHKDGTLNTKKINGDTTMQLDVIKEPCLHYLRNLLLSYPGCISVDEEGNRIFLSDSNHHRIIISDNEGRILDCIGSSPGFEDGEFQFAKLFRPAASFYDPTQNCLYFIDSENHAIRKADMDKRVLETMYPSCNQKNNGVLTWILDKLGLITEKEEQSDQPDSNLIKFPWHLIKTDQNDFIIIDRSFETSWVLSMVTWKVTMVLKGVSRIIEEHGHMIMKKMAILKDINDCSLQRFEHVFPLEGIPYAGLFSSIANLENNIIICDAAGQRVLKFHRRTRDIADMQFSNLEILGLPYWMVCPLETVFKTEYVSSPRKVHIRRFSVLPGRCNIHVNVDIPRGTELAAPLEEGCIWRQTRGSGAELSGNGEITDKEKVGVAQQWFDELDNLAFSRAGEELELQIEEHPDINLHDKDKVNFDSVVKLSPGTCELVVSAVLYLKLKDIDKNVEDQRSAFMRIVSCIEDDGRKDLEKEASIKLLEETYENAGDIVFMKPLHLRMILECADHPAGETSNETISTDTTLEVAISLD